MDYYKQEKDYTCGCASVRMAISYFEDDIPTEAELEKVLKTNDRIGTHPNEVIEYFRNRGYEVTHGENGTYEQLTQLIEDGYCIMLKVSVDVPHFTVVEKINDCHIFFYDPYFGKISKDRKKFFSEKQIFPHYRWKIVASEFKKYAPGYDFTELESMKGYIAVKTKNTKIIGCNDY